MNIFAKKPRWIILQYFDPVVMFVPGKSLGLPFLVSMKHLLESEFQLNQLHPASSWHRLCGQKWELNRYIIGIYAAQKIEFRNLCLKDIKLDFWFWIVNMVRWYLTKQKSYYKIIITIQKGKGLERELIIWYPYLRLHYQTQSQTKTLKQSQVVSLD